MSMKRPYKNWKEGHASDTDTTHTSYKPQNTCETKTVKKCNKALLLLLSFCDIFYLLFIKYYLLYFYKK